MTTTPEPRGALGDQRSTTSADDGRRRSVRGFAGPRGAVAIMPKRIQRKRTKGWRMPEGAVYVGRPTHWGNPFEAAVLGQQGAVDAFAVHIAAYFGWEDRMVRRAWHPWPVESTAFKEWIGPLSGHDLVCWCPIDQPCHADILLELANRDEGAA